jgi:hypothetical protein
MQGTTDVPHDIAHAYFPQANGRFQDAAAFDTAVDMFEAHAPPRQPPIPHVLHPRQLPAAGLCRRVEDGHTLQSARLQAQVLPELAAGRGSGVVAALRLSWTRPGGVALRKRRRQALVTSRRWFSMCRLFLPR